MREIKFRAWDKIHKRMLDVPALGFLSKKIDIQCELMQYTGLKDKNDKEIYEGDVVKYREGEAGRFYICTVEYINNRGKYLFVYDNQLCNFDLDGAWMTSEIIGNIYENPELINPNNTLTRENNVRQHRSNINGYCGGVERVE